MKNHQTNMISYYGLPFKKPLILFSLLVFCMSCHQSPATRVPANSPAETTLQRLLKGNERFSFFTPTHPDEDKQRLKDAANEQHPFAVVVCCSDSRVSPELIFDERMY